MQNSVQEFVRMSLIQKAVFYACNRDLRQVQRDLARKDTEWAFKFSEQQRQVDATNRLLDEADVQVKLLKAELVQVQDSAKTLPKSMKNR